MVSIMKKFHCTFTSIIRLERGNFDRQCFRFFPFLFSSPDKVAEGILQLITDTSKSGAIMTVTLAKGIKYKRMFGDPPAVKANL